MVAGGVGGTVGAIVTCPLEVVKTRLQSSSSGFDTRILSDNRRAASSVWQCLRQVLVQEGVPGLFRGLGPNLVGVAPSRAIYFWAYSYSKSRAFPYILGQRDTPLVHLTSAAFAGCVSSITTNPIWVVKTRLQLDREKKPTSLGNVVRQIAKEGGVRGFYLGLTASFYGVLETVAHFVVYEYLKKRMSAWLGQRHDQHDMKHFLGFMACGALSKTGATCLAYPHGKLNISTPCISLIPFSLSEVVRTRLREPGLKYRSFWQTMGLVYKEEGRPGLYRGLATNLVRQIPNTAVMMATYELTVHLINKYNVNNGNIV